MPGGSICAIVKLEAKDRDGGGGHINTKKAPDLCSIPLIPGANQNRSVLVMHEPRGSTPSRFT